MRPGTKAMNVLPTIQIQSDPRFMINLEKYGILDSNSGRLYNECHLRVFSRLLILMIYAIISYQLMHTYVHMETLTGRFLWT